MQCLTPVIGRSLSILTSKTYPHCHLLVLDEALACSAGFSERTGASTCEGEP